MNLNDRNMNDYVAQYQVLPFEPIQIKYRRKLVLDQISRLSPRRLLEIGCGELPLLTNLSADMEIIVVEPAAAFAENARRLSLGRDLINVVQGYFEDYEPDGKNFDMIVLSCVLHEVPDPAAMLSAIKRVCGPNTVLHVNVPNARSLHRLLAAAMGLIPYPGAQSDTQRMMQQRAMTYHVDSLACAMSTAGFEVLDHGSLFVKPFTHAQMQQLVDQGFMTDAMLDGLDNLVQILPDLGSEIWTNVRMAR